jgi:hypothetical protein
MCASMLSVNQPQVLARAPPNSPPGARKCRQSGIYRRRGPLPTVLGLKYERAETYINHANCWPPISPTQSLHQRHREQILRDLGEHRPCYSRNGSFSSRAHIGRLCGPMTGVHPGSHLIRDALEKLPRHSITFRYAKNAGCPSWVVVTIGHDGPSSWMSALPSQADILVRQ